MAEFFKLSMDASRVASNFWIVACSEAGCGGHLAKSIETVGNCGTWYQKESFEAVEYGLHRLPWESHVAKSSGVEAPDVSFS